MIKSPKYFKPEIFQALGQEIITSFLFIEIVSQQDVINSRCRHPADAWKLIVTQVKRANIILFNQCLFSTSIN